jgi:type IV fimbrial biogenesis protein FimT
MMQYLEHKNQSGFSLVELLISVFMLSILLTVGIPAFNGISQENALADISNRFISSITLARSEAVSKNTIVVMCQLNAARTACDNDGNWEDGWVVWIDLDGGLDLEFVNQDGEVEVVLVEDALPTGYTLTALNNQFSNVITFDSSGAATGDGGNLLELFQLCDPQLDNNRARIMYLNGVGHAWRNRTRGINGATAANGNPADC